MSTITDIVTHCRFEATAPDSDEVVLATILDVRRIPLLSLPALFLLPCGGGGGGLRVSAPLHGIVLRWRCRCC
jgi:hypothetical protein